MRWFVLAHWSQIIKMNCIGSFDVVCAGNYDWSELVHVVSLCLVLLWGALVVLCRVIESVLD